MEDMYKSDGIHIYADTHTDTETHEWMSVGEAVKKLMSEDIAPFISEVGSAVRGVGDVIYKLGIALDLSSLNEGGYYEKVTATFLPAYGVAPDFYRDLVLCQTIVVECENGGVMTETRKQFIVSYHPLAWLLSFAHDFISIRKVEARFKKEHSTKPQTMEDIPRPDIGDV